jgi:hypothetical protein
MNLPDSYRSLLDRSGISLQNPGLNEKALKRVDALYAVTVLRDAGVPILGGDVYFRHGNRIELAYANWHADPKPGEDRHVYLKRSWDTTESYVKRFPDTKDKEPLFVLVTG